MLLYELEFETFCNVILTVYYFSQIAKNASEIINGKWHREWVTTNRIDERAMVPKKLCWRVGLVEGCPLIFAHGQGFCFSLFLL